MNCALLNAGRKLDVIFWPGGSELRVGGGCASMTVVSVTGQSAYVPWVEVVDVNGRTYLYNAAHLKGVGFAEEEGEDG